MNAEPDKTFGLRSSTDLYLKLIYDIGRLRSGGGTKAVQYAAFDSAVTAAHILDWVLHELDDAAYLRLTASKRAKRRRRGAGAGRQLYRAKRRADGRPEILPPDQQFCEAHDHHYGPGHEEYEHGIDGEIGTRRRPLHERLRYGIHQT
ncbi:hypothetical protein [Rhizobium johnstonii]|uniref:hypothetical protein n=1 Tax=Rhizobium johnstonii TaxID=3019933 RepID=UPI003F9DAC23